jgi:hypothetical protein
MSHQYKNNKHNQGRYADAYNKPIYPIWDWFISLWAIPALKALFIAAIPDSIHLFPF